MWNTPYFSKVNVSFNTELHSNMFSGLSFYKILPFKKPYLLIFPKVTSEGSISLILEVKVVQKLWIVCHLFMKVFSHIHLVWIFFTAIEFNPVFEGTIVLE